jgi:DNA-binding transcriptional ArsR family regulator
MDTDPMAASRSGSGRKRTESTAEIPFPPVRIVSGTAFELIAELAAFTSGPARASLESGKAWIREVRALAAPDLIRRVEQWGFALYTELASIAIEAGPPFDPDRLVAAFRALPPDVLKRRLVGAESAPNRSMVSEGAFERGLAGDAVARAELRAALGLNPQARQAIGRLLTTSSEVVQDEVSSIVQSWASRVFPAFAEGAMTVIARDVAAKARLFDQTPAPEALQVALHGVDVEPAAWATDIVVIPTVAMRPFIAPVEFGSSAIFLCSVADEALDDDPAAPPRSLVKVAAAIGDELRLRILRVLADDELTASEIADRLGVERTSLHHHLGILRSAGLVAIHDDGVHGWRYKSRGDRVASVGDELAAYLEQPTS